MLALVRYSELTGDRHWIDVAAKGMDYIALVRDADKTPKNVEHDHWVLICLNELYRVEPRPHYLAHLKKIGAAIRSSQLKDSKYMDYNGGYYSSPRSTPAATRAEGMIAAYRLLRDIHDPDAPAYWECIDATARFMLWCQYTDENAMYVRNPAMAYGGIKEGPADLTMRIDYSQHHLCAMLGIHRILTSKEDR
jgi:hypothetical protein